MSKKNFIKKLSIGIFSNSILLLPSAMIISCNEKKETNSHQEIKVFHKYLTKQNRFKPFDFNSIDPNEPKFLLGAQYTAYSQGLSFMLNIAKQMGWNWEDKKLIDNLHNPKFDWDTIDVTKNPSSLYNENVSETDFEKFLYDENIKNNVGDLMRKYNISLKSHLWNVIKSFEWVNPKDKKIILNMDASTQQEINLGSDFNKLQNKEKLKRFLVLLNNNSDKIFPHKKYAYNWSGTELKKLAFQIFNNRLVVWHYSKGPNEWSLSKIKEDKENIHMFDQGIKENLYDEDDFQNNDSFPKNYAIQRTKRLSQILLDPFGADGTSEQFTLLGAMNSKIDPSKNFNPNKSIEYFKSYNSLKSYSTGAYEFNGVEKEFLAYNSFIDAEKPGQTIMKIFIGDGKSTSESLTNEYYYPLKTFKSPKIIQTFYQIKNSTKKKEFYYLISNFFHNLKRILYNNDKSASLMMGKVSPIIASFFNFCKYYVFDNKQIKKAFDAINNGSHYMLGVEMFLRGISNLPQDQVNIELPIGYKFAKIAVKDFEQKMILNKNNSYTILGMINGNKIANMLNYMYNTKELEMARNFNPQTKKLEPWFDIKESMTKFNERKNKDLFINAKFKYMFKDFDNLKKGTEVKSISDPSNYVNFMELKNNLFQSIVNKEVFISNKNKQEFLKLLANKKKGEYLDLSKFNIKDIKDINKYNYLQKYIKFKIKDISKINEGIVILMPLIRNSFLEGIEKDAYDNGIIIKNR